MSDAATVTAAGVEAGENLQASLPLLPAATATVTPSWISESSAAFVGAL